MGKQTTTTQGEVIEVHRLKSSRNGNPRFRYTIKTDSGHFGKFRTSPDSSIAYMGIKEGERVELDWAHYYGKPTVFRMERIG